MKFYFSELCLLGEPVFSNVDRILEAGCDRIELMMDGPGWNRFDTRMDFFAEGLLSRKAVYSVHTPVWDANLTSENFFIRKGAMESIRFSIELADRLRAGHVVIHPGFCMSRCFCKETAKERACQALRELVEFNRGRGLRLLVENVGDTDTSLFTQQEFAGFLEGFPSEVGYLVDVGHAHLNGWDIPQLLSAVKDRLFAVHLHDNNGSADQHLPIGQGSIDWAPIFSVLRTVEHDVNLVLEYKTGTPLSVLCRDRALLERQLS